PRMLLHIPFGLLPHLAVFWMLQAWFYEPAVWPVFFSSYGILFATIWLHERAGRPTTSRNERTYWSAWIGQLHAAALIAVALRTTYPGPPREVVLLMYPVLAALNGMAFFIDASRMPWTFRWGPYGYWLTGLVMLIYLPWAPLFFCAFTAFGYSAYALYLV